MAFGGSLDGRRSQIGTLTQWLLSGSTLVRIPGSRYLKQLSFHDVCAFVTIGPAFTFSET